MSRSTALVIAGLLAVVLAPAVAPAGPGGGEDAPAAPAGDEILFCSGIQHAASLWRVRTDGGSPAAPLGLGGRGAVWPDVDPTGTKLLYTKHVWDPNIWRVALTSSGRAAGWVPAGGFMGYDE